MLQNYQIRTGKAKVLHGKPFHDIRGPVVLVLFAAVVLITIARGGLALLGSSALFPLGVALLIIGLTLEAGATGAVKAIKVSAKHSACAEAPHLRVPSRAVRPAAAQAVRAAECR